MTTANYNNLYISGTPEVFPSDAIGDALRASAVGYWKCDEADMPWDDSVSHANSLIYEDPGFVSVPGKLSGAVGYTDVESGLGILFSEAPISNLVEASTSFWLNISTSFGAEGISTILKTPDEVYVDASGDNRITIEPDNGPGTFQAISPNTWYHIVVTSDSLNHALYINGVLAYSTTIQQTPVDYYFNMAMAGNNGVDHYYIDEFAVFDRIIDSDEIAYLYNSGAGRTLYP